MRSNRLRGCLVVATLFTGASSASAQDTDDKTDDKAAPRKVAQAEPEPAPPPAPSSENRPDSAGPSTPGAREAVPMTEEQMRKMIEAEVAKSRPKGPAVEFSGYGRAAVGLNPRGGKQVCFGLAGADTKWRLGNECDYVFEPQFTGRLVTLEDKSSWAGRGSSSATPRRTPLFMRSSRRLVGPGAAYGRTTTQSHLGIGGQPEARSSLIRR